MDDAIRKIVRDDVGAFVKDSLERTHRRDYESALQVAGRDGPDWDDLTDEQRANIRRINLEYRQEMQEFGNSLRIGNP